MNAPPLPLCRAAVARCINRYELGDDDANPLKQRLWSHALSIMAGLTLDRVPEGLQYEVEATLGEADPRGGWAALACVLLNCQETVNAAQL